MQSRTALVTGVTGQDGSYLSELLLKHGYTVYGLARRSSVDTTERISHIINHPGFRLLEGDITDAACINHVVSGIKPTEIYNLAAMSHVGTSFSEPIATCHADAIGPLNILEAIRQLSQTTKFYQASTSELFGDTKTVPQNENTPFIPNSPYAAAKLYAHNMVGLYRRAYGLFACSGILFNHESQRRGKKFVTRKITEYVAMIKYWKHCNGRLPVVNVDVCPLLLGNVDAKRDWSHAEDMVRGMWLMLQHKEPDDYVLGSGETHSVREFLSTAFDTIGVDYWDYISIDKDLYRPAEVPLLKADPTKAKNVLGWSITIDFNQLVSTMIDSDYNKLLNPTSRLIGV